MKWSVKRFRRLAIRRRRVPPPPHQIWLRPQKKATVTKLVTNFFLSNAQTKFASLTGPHFFRIFQFFHKPHGSSLRHTQECAVQIDLISSKEGLKCICFKFVHIRLRNHKIGCRVSHSTVQFWILLFYLFAWQQNSVLFILIIYSDFVCTATKTDITF